MIHTQRIGGAHVAVQPGEARYLQSVERRNQDGYLPCVYTITVEDYPARVALTVEEDAATVIAEQDAFVATTHVCGVCVTLDHVDRRALRTALEMLGVTYWQIGAAYLDACAEDQARFGT